MSTTETTDSRVRERRPLLVPFHTRGIPASLLQKPQSHCCPESVIPGRGRRANDRNQIARSGAGARGTEGASRVKLPAPGRCASAGHRSRAMTGLLGKAGGGEGGWGTAFPVFLRAWRGIPGLRRRRGSRVVPRPPCPPALPNTPLGRLPSGDTLPSRHPHPLGADRLPSPTVSPRDPAFPAGPTPRPVGQGPSYKYKSLSWGHSILRGLGVPWV